MPIFLERFVLPVLAASMIGVIVLNPFKFDWQQKLALGIVVLAGAYFVGHTLYKNKTVTTQISVPAPETPKNSGNATTSGDESPAVTGDKNTIEYSQPTPPKKQTTPPKIKE